MSRRIVVVFSGRLPGEKAASLFAHLEATSFAALGREVVVLAPRRLRRQPTVHTSYRAVYLFTVDLAPIPLVRCIAGYVNLIVLSVAASVWFFLHGRASDIVISNEAVPLLVLTYLAHTTVYELHDFPRPGQWSYRALFRRVRLVISTNAWKRTELQRVFGISDKRIVVERNAVDLRHFGHLSRVDARRLVGVEEKASLIVYTGQLYPWKGADVLAAAAEQIPAAQFVFVGGVGEELAHFRARWQHVPNIRVEGQVPHERIPAWQAAADILVLPNSAHEPLSERYTSPMKLFEYMASKRPIVASDVESIREVVDDSMAYFVTPDDASALALCLARVLRDPVAAERARRARATVESYGWSARAHRILAAVEAA
jgi:glycosyltransferase involved in cell wall biosynthesis